MVDAIDELGRGRESYARRAWMDAYKSLSHADQAAVLGAEDLELLATSAYMLGRDDDYLSGLERAHHAHLDSSEAMRAVRCAFWIGMIPPRSARACARDPSFLYCSSGLTTFHGIALYPLTVRSPPLALRAWRCSCPERIRIPSPLGV